MNVEYEEAKGEFVPGADHDPYPQRMPASAAAVRFGRARDRRGEPFRARWNC